MASASDFVKAAVEDDFGILLAAEFLLRNSKPPPPKFCLQSYDESRCKEDFRFFKQDIYRLLGVLKIPRWMKTDQGALFRGSEGLCLLLRRLAYPNRLADLQLIFGRSKQALSKIINKMISFLFQHFEGHLSTFNQPWLAVNELKKYAVAIGQKGCPLDGCFGFIDGTIHRTCRPIRNQRQVYSGHKRTHCLKYQSVVIPNGLIAHLYGPEPGRRHDSFMLKRSEILDQMEAQLGREKLYLYGDSGYPLKRRLITPHLGNNLSVEKQQFNEAMSKLRIAVEWEFGDLFEQFAFLHFKYNQKIYLQPLAKYIKIAVFLKNCHTCLYGSQTSSYFNVDPPSLETYVNKRNV